MFAGGCDARRKGIDRRRTTRLPGLAVDLRDRRYGASRMTAQVDRRALIGLAGWLALVFVAAAIGAAGLNDEIISRTSGEAVT